MSARRAPTPAASAASAPPKTRQFKLRDLTTIVAGPWTKQHCIIRARSVESRRTFAITNSGLTGAALAAFGPAGQNPTHPLHTQVANVLVYHRAAVRDFKLFQRQLCARQGRLPARMFIANARALDTRLLWLQDAVRACGQPGPSVLVAEPPAFEWAECAELHPEFVIDGGDLALCAHIFSEASDLFSSAIYLWRADALQFLDKRARSPRLPVPPQLFGQGNVQLIDADGQLWAVLQFLRDHVAEAQEALARSALVRAARQQQREAKELERVHSAPPTPEVLAQLSLYEHFLHEALTDAGVRHWWADGAWQWAPQHAQAAARAQAFAAVNMLD